MSDHREAGLKAAFIRELLRQLPDFYILQYATAAAPDREIVGHGKSTRWEFKHACPSFVSHQNQILLCARLASADHCRYVFWHESEGRKRTAIVHPLRVLDKTLEPEMWTHGFDHRWLVEQVKKAHGLSLIHI